MPGAWFRVPYTPFSENSYPQVAKSRFAIPSALIKSELPRRVCKNVGIEDFRFHDLRHTAASWLRMQGADIHTVALLLGHKDLRMTARYSHLSPAFLAEAVGRLDDVFGAVRYQDVTAPMTLALSASVTLTK
jgi:integrase